MPRFDALPEEVQRACVVAGLRPVVCDLAADEVANKRANQHYLGKVALTSRTLNAIATPLLYERVMLADDFVGGYETVHATYWQWAQRRSALTTLLRNPGLAALVRELWQGEPFDVGLEPDQIFNDPILTLFTLVPCLPNLRVLSGFELHRFEEPKERLPCSLLQLKVCLGHSLSPANDVKLSSWLDLGRLTRLDISMRSYSSSMAVLLDPAVLPRVVDLRVGHHSWIGGLGHLSLGLKKLGPQLRTLHLRMKTLEGEFEPDVEAGDDTLPFDVLRFCPSLEVLAFDPREIPWPYLAPKGPAERRLDRLVLCDSRSPTQCDAELERLIPSARGDLVAPKWLLAAHNIKPRVLVLSGLDIRRWNTMQRVAGCSTATFLTKADVAVVDRNGVIIAPRPDLIPAGVAVPAGVAAP